MLGFVIVVAGFFIDGAAGHFADETGEVSSWLMLGSYGAISLGELRVRALGLAVIAC